MAPESTAHDLGTTRPLDGLISLDWSLAEPGIVADLRLHASDLGLPQWRVVHAVPLGSREAFIEHLVIGPGGVFAVTTVTEPEASVWVVGDSIKVDGHSASYVARTRHDATVARASLTRAAGRSVAARGVVALICPSDRFTVKLQPTDVTVMMHRWLQDFFATRPVVMTADEVTDVERLARLTSTWITSG